MSWTIKEGAKVFPEDIVEMGEMAERPAGEFTIIAANIEEVFIQKVNEAEWENGMAILWETFKVIPYGTQMYYCVIGIGPKQE